MKFLDTNITVDNFLSALAKFENELPDLLRNWNDIDPELQTEYLDQMTWNLDKAAEFIKKQSVNK